MSLFDIPVLGRRRRRYQDQSGTGLPADTPADAGTAGEIAATGLARYGRGVRLVAGTLALLSLTVVFAMAHVMAPQPRNEQPPVTTKARVATATTAVTAAAASTASIASPTAVVAVARTARPLAAPTATPSPVVDTGVAPAAISRAVIVTGRTAVSQPSPSSADTASATLVSAASPRNVAAQSAAIDRTPAPSAVTVASSGRGITAMSALPIQPYAVAPAITTSHPRLLLDTDTLAALRQRAADNADSWKRLKAKCDSYIGGSVNYPDGNAYPDLPNLGQGYQGSEYVTAVISEALCYQVLKSSNPDAAAPYGAKAVDILVKMSAPPGGQGQDPCTDDGYGIRNYGVGFGLAYDWVHELLSADQRSQVYNTANTWITTWEQPGGCADFEYEHPQSNYFAGYFHAKAAIALATYGDNPSAAAMWDDWYNNQFGNRVQPFYAEHLAGGGWPEGYGNYAALGILNMSLPAREVMTATGLDLVHAGAPYSFPVDSADYAMHFTWPSRVYFDDRDTNHSTGSVSPPPGATPVNMFQQVLGALTFWKSSKASVFHAYLNEVSKAMGGGNYSAAWLEFLSVDPKASTTPIDTLPLSYFARGMGAVAARSDWSKSASWMSFRAGPYVNNPAQGEEGFDQGSLALARGNVPLLVNTYGWIVHEPNGTSDEDLAYSDLYGTFNGSVYFGNRQMYNVYYVRNMNGSTVADRFGQAAYTTESNSVSTQVSAYEDGTDYVYLQSVHLEDMYRAFSAGPGVKAWSRQVVYLRPSRFVVFDRTTEGSANYDQYLAWHFPASPTVSGNRLDVTYDGTYAGAMTTVLPLDTTATTVALYPSSNTKKVWQVQVRPPDSATSQQWLTVLDLSTSAAKAATATPVNVTSGAVVGVNLAASDGNSVVVTSSGAAGTPITTAFAYDVPPSVAHHVITGLQASTGYNIVVTTGGTWNVQVSPGGTYVSSAKGVLNFYLDGSGKVETVRPETTSLPISWMPVGTPTPYKP